MWPWKKKAKKYTIRIDFKYENLRFLVTYVTEKDARIEFDALERAMKKNVVIHRISDACLRIPDIAVAYLRIL